MPKPKTRKLQAADIETMCQILEREAATHKHWMVAENRLRSELPHIDTADLQTAGYALWKRIRTLINRRSASISNV